MTNQADHTHRFSDRVENYIKYRPGYPAGILEILHTECGLSDHAKVADIGSGTGILTRLFLEYGCTVSGVEPNQEMRQAGERLLAGYRRFTSVEATAEATTLPAHTFDFITAGQAFHWFDVPKSRIEFLRILRPQGWVVMVWNERQVDSTPFLIAYEKILHDYAVDYSAVDHRHFGPERIQAFYNSPTFQTKKLSNRQEFDWEGLRGRVLSSSYVPLPGQPNYAVMQAKLEDIFERFQENGKVAFEYETQLYFGQLG